MEITGTLVGITLRPKIQALEVAFLKGGGRLMDGGEEDSRFMKAPSHTYGAIQCGGKPVATDAELYNYVVNSPVQDIAVTLHFESDDDDAVAGRAEFTHEPPSN